ncbi:leukocyte receptor cluster member 9 isoform X2 [Nerophis ophidion]|uniref:leukocyte receptor cluster member 9 isoform X2 n=1 Tax=Nerophis ophidion TaxID=159077 RepID=UPI002ADFF7A8|nr:leukocyte receptor cluster member 9 isoform X2 [Nerophis ophidion]
MSRTTDRLNTTLPTIHRNTTNPGQGMASSESDTGDAALVDAPEAQTGEEGVQLCPFFLKGKCHFGLRCRLSHKSVQLVCEVPCSSGAPIEGAATAPGLEAEPQEEKQRKKKWDPSVDASHFLVGYTDRFLGVLERPFADFNWDVKPCDCDYTAELALPRHRIQYFAYQGTRVWDRRSRTDRVFGSTGQSLAPPFGGQGEVEERHVDRGEDPPAAHLDQDHVDTHGADSAQASPEWQRVAEEAANSATASSDREERLTEGASEGGEGFERRDNPTPPAAAEQRLRGTSEVSPSELE